MALWKNAEKTKVRPISGGVALRKLIVKAHCDQVREELIEHVGDSQLGVMKGGYETGIHAMRALSKLCMEDGDVILIVDFANAFNSCNRNLLIKLVSTHIPEVATLAFWLYAEEAELYLDNGDTLVSSEGGQQGCGLMNLLFALLMKWIMRQIQKEGVDVKGAYWDDAWVKATPRAAAKTLEILKSLEEKTNLKLRLSKCHAYAPNSKIADLCRELFPTGVQIHEDMNIIMLKTAIGSDQFVKEQLEVKLGHLKSTIRKISKLPFTMEGFTLLRNCLTQCKVTHLMRTIPPKQIEKFLMEYDAAVREGFECLIDTKLEDKWWGMARFQSKHGGMGLRTGLHTTGAQYLSSLAKCSEDISKFVPSWNGSKIAQEDTEWWLERQIESKIDVGDIYNKIRDDNNGHGNLSIAQKCETKEAQRVKSLMSGEELLHVRSNCGPGGAWVRVTPLSWKAWEMKPKQWLVAARRRLLVPIAPY